MNVLKSGVAQVNSSKKRLQNIIYSFLLVAFIAAAAFVIVKRQQSDYKQSFPDIPQLPEMEETELFSELEETPSDDASGAPAELEENSEESVPAEISLFGNTVSISETYLDLSSYSSAEIELEIDNLAAMKNIKEINFIDADGCCNVGTDTLDKVRTVLPDAVLDSSFELFGKTVTSGDIRIEYVKENIGNDGVDRIRAVLPYLSSCEYFLLDECGIDNEILASLRDDFPERNIVWRIHMSGNDTYLTDITVFRCTKICDADCETFKYCSALKYIDVGHTLSNLSDISFVRYMPNLEVLILAHSDVEDISALAYCKNLEYLEIFATKVTDISALAECENLQHLNMTCQRGINDLTPLFGLKNLKRLRINIHYFPMEQVDTISRLMPDCAMEFGDGDDILGGWRYYLYKGVPEMSSRYALLREQFQYGKGDSYVK